jgi:hypothetical protein
LLPTPFHYQSEICYHQALILIGAETMKFFQYSGSCHLDKILKAAHPSISLVVLLLVTALILPSFGSAETRKEYYPNGNLKSEMNIVNDKMEGLEKNYTENGQLWLEKNYINGKAEGLAKYYYDNGQLRIEINYKNDKQEGLQKDYFMNGNLQYEANYKNGKREGE